MFRLFRCFHLNLAFNFKIKSSFDLPNHANLAFQSVFQLKVLSRNINSHKKQLVSQFKSLTLLNKQRVFQTHSSEISCWKIGYNGISLGFVYPWKRKVILFYSPDERMSDKNRVKKLMQWICTHRGKHFWISFPVFSRRHKLNVSEWTENTILCNYIKKIYK